MKLFDIVAELNHVFIIGSNGGNLSYVVVPIIQRLMPCHLSCVVVPIIRVVRPRDHNYC